MELDLKEIGQTLAVGALAVFGLLALAQIFRKASVLIETVLQLLHEPLKGQLQGAQHHLFIGAVYLALIFAFGITVEDVSKRVAAERLPYFLKRLCSPYIFPTDKMMRTAALFGNPEQRISGSTHDEKTPLGVLSTPSSLAYDIAEDHLYDIPTPDKAARNLQLELIRLRQLDKSSKQVTLPLQEGQLEEIVSRLYYQSHNAIYLGDHGLHELERLETRMDFARALLFTSIVLCIALILLFAYYLHEYLFWRLLGLQLRHLLAASLIFGTSLGSAWAWSFYAPIHTPKPSAATTDWDYLSSFTTSSAWNTMALFTLASLAVTICLVWINRIQGKREPSRANGNTYRVFNKETALQVVVFLLPIGAFIGLGYQSYFSESMNYNIRVFGYYQSLHAQQPKANIAHEHQPFEDAKSILKHN